MGAHIFSNCRFPPLLRCGCHLLQRYDLQGRSKAWKEEPPHIHLDLLYRWICIRHVGKGFWYRLEVDFEREQPTYAPIDLRFRYRHCMLHIDPDELLQ